MTAPTNNQEQPSEPASAEDSSLLSRSSLGYRRARQAESIRKRLVKLTPAESAALPPVEELANGVVETQVEQVWGCAAAKDRDSEHRVIVMHMTMGPGVAIKPYLTLPLAEDLVGLIFAQLPADNRARVLDNLRADHQRQLKVNQ